MFIAASRPAWLDMGGKDGLEGFKYANWRVVIDLGKG